MLEKTFGVKLENESYVDRIGIYAIIFDNKGNVATVKTQKGNFLIGGGIDAGETHQDCLIRECLEEIGFNIKIENFICKSDKYYYAESLKYFFHPIGYFYLVELKDKVQEPVETDHKFEWISIEELEDKIYLEHQTWAIKQAFQLKNS